MQRTIQRDTAFSPGVRIDEQNYASHAKVTARQKFSLRRLLYHGERQRRIGDTLLRHQVRRARANREAVVHVAGKQAAKPQRGRTADGGRRDQQTVQGKESVSVSVERAGGGGGIVYIMTHATVIEH